MSGKGESIEKLDAPERLSHHRWEWSLERLGWIVMAGVIVAGLAGGLGRGPLVRRDVANDDGSSRARYYAVERAAAPTRLDLWWDASQVRGPQIDVAMSRSFADGTTIESIVPKPLEVVAREGQIIYSFIAADSPNGEEVTFHYKHEAFGPFDYEVAVGDREPIRVRQFVLP